MGALLATMRLGYTAKVKAASAFGHDLAKLHNNWVIRVTSVSRKQTMTKRLNTLITVIPVKSDSVP